MEDTIVPEGEALQAVGGAKGGAQLFSTNVTDGVVAGEKRVTIIDNITGAHPQIY